MTKSKAAKLDPLTHEEDPILSCSEVGRQIGKHRTTVWRWVQCGLIKGFPMPNHDIGIRKSEVNKILSASALDARVE